MDVSMIVITHLIGLGCQIMRGYTKPVDIYQVRYRLDRNEAIT
jgi:hypothetical protein